MPLECPREKMFCLVDTVLPVASSWIRQRYVVHLVSRLRRPRAVVERPRRQVFQKRQDGNLWNHARGKPNHWFAHLWKLRRRQEACRRLSRDCACARVDCFHGWSSLMLSTRSQRGLANRRPGCRVHDQRAHHQVRLRQGHYRVCGQVRLLHVPHCKRRW